jgi:hypothetical protein
MNKLLIIIAFALSLTFAQEVRELRNGTLANNAQIEAVFTFGDPASKVDSVVFVLYTKGEIDIDHFTTQRGVNTAGRIGYTPLVSADSVVVTVNLDSAATLITKLATRTDLSGINHYKVTMKAAASGNDATDPNEYRLYVFIYKD